MSQPLIESAHHDFVLPLMQGFIGQRAFTINKKANESSKAIPNAEQTTAKVTEAQDRGESVDDRELHFLLTLISRRSIKRPGLRYLRYDKLR